MSHEEYRRRVPGAKTGVLMLHGIVGSPQHFRALIDLQSRVPSSCSLFNVRYPGHGGSVSDFGRSRLRQWRQHAFRSFEELAATHEKVILVGHSMGCLFAMQIAMQYPEKVEKLYLLQVPLYVGLRWFGIKNMLVLPFGTIKPENVIGSAMLAAHGVRLTPLIWKYWRWLFRVAELLVEMNATAKRIEDLTVPAVAFQSRKDELVSNRSAKRLRQSGRVEVVELENSTHFYYTPEDKTGMISEFDNLCR